MKKNGFTLIELLVVIAIIGILAGIVLVSVGTARNKAKDVAVKADLSNLRAAAELYNDSSGSYTDFCTSGDYTRASAGITSAGGTAECSATASAWVACSTLVATTGTGWCVDSLGNSKARTAATCTLEIADQDCD